MNRDIVLFRRHVRVMAAVGKDRLLKLGNRPLTCVIKTNPGGYFSAITMISTMISRDAYETPHPLGRGSRTAGWLALRGSIGKEIGHVI